MLYNSGTIAINGNTATGTGTNWTAPASQVRAGQTIIVMSNPVQLFQISSVNSAASLTVTPAASPALSGQKYGILVSDIISVDGLAQAMSQLIKEYDENISGWETFATTTANQNITVTINGAAVNIPGIGGLARKGTNSDITELKGLTTAITLAQGGTGAKTAAGARTSLGLGSMATQSSDAVNITGGSGTFTSLSSDAVAITGGTASLGTIETKAGAEQPLVIRTAPSGLGYIRFRDASENPLAYLGFGASGAQHFILASNIGVNSVTLNTTGAVTVKAGGANYAFQTNGTATGQLWQSTSDVRIKKDIKPITNAREVISAITGYTFKKRYNLYDVAEPLYTEEAGILAQELELVAPEAVSKNDFGAHDLENNPIDDLRAVNYAGITPYLIELAKLHEAEISELKGEVSQLKELVSSMAQGS